jgi:hypothetical protein
MGGHALSPGLTQRKPLQEYLEIKQQVLALLSSAPPPLLFQFDTVTEVPQKEEFGDLDLIYFRSPHVTEVELQTFIRNLFHPTEIFQCGNVTSFDFQSFQIDFIECPEPNLPLTKFCLSYGDRGMILGQIARWHGFSLGFHGLMLTSEDLERLCEVKGVTEKIVLTIDPQEIKSYLGLPLTDDEIMTPEDIGRYCRSSPWYRPEIFTGKLNAEGRKRWAKRPYYRHFILQIIAETAAHYRFLLSRAQQPPGEDHLFHFLDQFLFSELSEQELQWQQPQQETNAADPHFFSRTPAAVLQRQRMERIRAALTHFQKWGEVEEIRRRHLERQERREKLNYSLLMELGIPSEELAAARLEFLRWVLRHRPGEGGRAGKEVTEGNREEVEVELLKNETVESTQEKLRRWLGEERRAG